MRQSRYFVTMGFMLVPSKRRQRRAFALEEHVFMIPGSMPLMRFQKYGITHVSFLLHSLMQALVSLTEDYVKLANLRLLTIGLAVSEAVRTRVLHAHTSHFYETYGANECSTISTMNEEGLGVLLPGVDVETVNDGDEPVVVEPGWIRVRSSGCVSGYINNPEATQKIFKNGWFYPGDVGVLKDHRMLKLIGRADDLLNIRRIKYAPQEIEDNLLAALPIREIGSGP